MRRSPLFQLARAARPRPTDPERRRFLQGMLAVGAASLLSSRLARAGGSGPRVIVVGAGFAGLACAYELHRAGADVTVLEARNRVGGRVLTLRQPNGTVIEGGAELIGNNHPHWLTYAERFGLRVRPFDELKGAEPLVLGGRLLGKGEAARVWRRVDKALSVLTAQAEAVDGAEPWNSPGAVGLDARSLADWLGAQPMGASDHALLVALMAGNNAVPLEVQSLLANLAQIQAGGGEAYWTESEIGRCEGGNHQLAERLARELGDRVRLGTEVVAIEHDADRIEVATTRGRLEADRLVLAVPSPTWKRIAMRPGLPPAWSVPMGFAVKHMTSLSRPVWRDQRQVPDLYSDGPVPMTWDATDGQPGEGRVLTVFAGGDRGRELASLDDNGRNERIDTTLDAIWPGFAAAAGRRWWMNWPGETFTGGGYSFPPLRWWTGAGKEAYDGLPTLRLSGEHLNPGFPGYMEGALGSGARVAAVLAAEAGLG